MCADIVGLALGRTYDAVVLASHLVNHDRDAAGLGGVAWLDDDARWLLARPA